MSTVSLTSANFVRWSILRNPEISLGEIQSEWNKSHMPPRKLPVMKNLYDARSQIKQKYELSDLKGLPRLPNGSLDPVGLVRLLISKNGKNITEKQASNWLAMDGVALTSTQFKEAMGDKTTVTAVIPTKLLQDATEVRTATQGRKLQAARYAKMEADLDQLVDDARSAQNPELLEQFRQLRRSVIIKGVEFAGK